MKLPLIRRRLATPSPRGEGFKRGNHFAFKRNETVRYKTGDARPGGEKRLYQMHIFKFQTVCKIPLRSTRRVLFKYAAKDKAY